jgi:hypothetical protein
VYRGNAHEELEEPLPHWRQRRLHAGELPRRGTTRIAVP